MSTRPRLRGAERAWIRASAVEMYNAGTGIAEIARRLQPHTQVRIDAALVVRLLREAGIAPEPSGQPIKMAHSVPFAHTLPDESERIVVRDAAARLYEQGLSLRTVADELARIPLLRRGRRKVGITVSHETVRALLIEAGVQLRPGPRKGGANAPP